MGLFRLRIREFAKQQGLTLKAISIQANVPYSTVATYSGSPGMATADIPAVMRIAQVLDVSIEELVEVIEGADN
ncbi:MAG: helix-turn-helix domain-containing protein [Leptolyngbyaceae cyanobacterium]